MGTLAAWYRSHGRHDLPWRSTRDPWSVLVSEVMLHQTQVARVRSAWPEFIGRYPTPAAMAELPIGDVIRSWGTLGYPRRARALWETARILTGRGWPDDLTELPGVGRYTAAAVAAQAHLADVPAVDANIRRVAERCEGRRLGDDAAEAASVALGAPLRGRDRLLALMDVGALVCTPRAPACSACPLAPGCTTRGPLPNGTRRRQAPYAGSFRQRRGTVLAALREGPQPTARLDPEALSSLEADGLARVTGPPRRAIARLP